MDEVARTVDGAETFQGPIRLRNCVGTFEVEGRAVPEEVLHVAVRAPLADRDMERYARFHMQYVTARADPPAGAVWPFSIVYDLTMATSPFTLTPHQLMTLVQMHGQCGEMYARALPCTVICLSNSVVRSAINAVLQPPVYRPVRPLTFAPSLDSPATLLFFREARARRFAELR
jgi:hypothetical protein